MSWGMMLGLWGPREGTNCGGEEEKRSIDESLAWDKLREEAAVLGAARRAQKRYDGVRQRPSGRWVAKLKDTIQKIRAWLGTYDTAEAAARAYDAAACPLRGANTWTNFWPSLPSPNSKPALSPKITSLLLLRLKAGNNAASPVATANAVPVNNPQDQEVSELEGNQFDNIFHVREDCSIIENTGTGATSSPMPNSGCMSGSLPSITKTEDGNAKIFDVDDNWSNVDAVLKGDGESGRRDQSFGISECLRCWKKWRKNTNKGLISSPGSGHSFTHKGLFLDSF